MRNFFVLLLTALLMPVMAQTRLSDSRQSSEKTYIYTVSKENLRKIHLNEKPVDENMFGTEVDQYPRAAAVPALPRGNYMLVTALGNKLEVKEHAVDDFSYRILPASDFRLFLTDTLGNVIADAKVKHGLRSLAFDAALQVYRCGSLRNNEVLEVDHRGVVHYITVNKSGNNPSFFKRIGNKIATFFKTVSREVKSWFVTPEVKPTSFMVYSKPRYKPGETVRMKAYATSHRGEPYDKPVDVRLKSSSYRSSIDTLITTLTPYRPGMYRLDLQLTDSLNLNLDSDYALSLESGGKSLVSSYFTYEDYELKGLTLTLQTGKKVYTANDTLRIGFDVRDENGMAVNDGRLQIHVSANMGAIDATDTPDFYFIPDTLWSSTCYLDTLTEKKFTIPNSVFPDGVALSFQVQCFYLSPDNESYYETVGLFREASAYTLVSTFKKGMLSLAEFHNEASVPGGCEIRFDTPDNILSHASLQLPGQIAVPWNATRIHVTTPHCTKTFDVEKIENYSDHQLDYDFYRRNDSIGLTVDNPAGLPFWYSIYRKNKVIASGYGTQLNFRLPNAGEEGYAFSLNYLFGATSRSLNGTLPYYNPNLQIDVITPQRVTPGQTVPVQVALRDRKGLPVADADVTAFAYTSKFNAGAIGWITPSGIYREAQPAPDTRYNDYGNNQESVSAPLTWGRWRDVMALDTIEYYLFLYPEHHYSIAENSKHDQTLVAPFVVEEGNVLDVAMLWIDDVLHYSSCAGQENPYVFAVTPGVHTFRFRTPQYEVEVDNVLIREGKKNIFSFNVKHADPAYANHPEMPRIRTTEVPRKKKGYFSEEEIRVLTNNLILVNDLGTRIAFRNSWDNLKLPQWLKGGERLYPLASENVRGNALLVGPFPQRFSANGVTDILQMYEMDSLWVSFPLVGGGVYSLYRGSAFSQDWNKPRCFSSIPSGFTPAFRAMPIDKEGIYEDFRIRKFMKAQRGNGIIATDTKGKQRNFGKAKLTINLDDLRRNNRDIYGVEGVTPVLMFVEESDGATSVCYGNTLSFNSLQPGETHLTLLYADSTYFKHTVSLRDGGRNFLNIKDIGKQPVDDWSRSIFHRFDSALTIIPLVNPYATPADSMKIHTAPTSWPYTVTGQGEYAYFEEHEDIAFNIGISKRSSMPMAKAEMSVLNEVAVVTDAAVEIAADTEALPVEPMAESVPEKSLRHDFRDDAFWQPSLRTDSLGVATFEVTYPDDITAWDAFFIGTGNKKQQNMRKLNIRSILMRSARLSVPRFAIEGDSLTAIGRIVNHEGDTVSVERSFTANGKTRSARIEVARTYLDPIPVVAGDEDSLTVVYQISMLDGSSDGEERKIPVLPKGMLKAEGEFCIINGTEKQVLKLGTGAPATLHAETTPLNVFLEEIARVTDYPYDCNEQMASKVKMLLARKSIYSTLGKRSNDDKQIRSLIAKLVKNQNADGLWGWWNKDGSEIWISQQVIGALAKAEAAGYRANWNKKQPIGWLNSRLTSMLDFAQTTQAKKDPFLKANLLDLLLCMKQLEAPIDYNYYLMKINTVLPDKNITAQIKEMQLLVLTDQTERIDKESLLKVASKTLLGSLYWEDKTDKPMPLPRFFVPNRNRLITTVEAYEVLRAANAPAETLEQIRNYFFEWRRTGYWQNTYESSRILEAILPDMPLSNGSAETVLLVNGVAVSRFPYTAPVEAGKAVEVSKTGASPVFVSLYSEEWQADPAAESKKGFRVQSRFADNGGTVERLQAGKPVALEVEVTCDETASYVQLEVPIPGGCSYDSKPNGGWPGNEAHREYFKEKTLIFCPELTPGTHTFRIELMPRYTGRYTLNPAKAELMYFPTFYGNEPVRRVSVTD